MFKILSWKSNYGLEVKITLLFAVLLCIICKPERTSILLSSHINDRKYGKWQWEWPVLVYLEDYCALFWHNTILQTPIVPLLPHDTWSHSKGPSCLLNISWIFFNLSMWEIFYGIWTSKEFLPHLPQDQVHPASFGRQYFQNRVF